MLLRFVIVPVAVLPVKVGLSPKITGPLTITFPVCKCAALKASPLANPITLMVYFKELSEKSCNVAVPVSFLSAGAGFSFLVDKAILHSFTTVAAGCI